MSSPFDVNNLRQIVQSGSNVTIPEITLAVYDKSAPIDYKNKLGSWFQFNAIDKTGKIPVKYWGGQDKNKTQKLYQSFEKGDVIVVSNGSAGHDKYLNDICLSLNDGISSIRKT